MTTRQDLVSKFMALAALIQGHSNEVAEAIRAAARGQQIEYTWLVRWSEKTTERVIGHAWALFAPYCGNELFPGILHEYGRYQTMWANPVRATNEGDLVDAKRARALGMNVENIQAQYPEQDITVLASKEEFDRVVKTALPVWVDNAIQGRIEIGQEPGWDEEGRSCQVPIYGDELVIGPGFKVEGVSGEWIGERNFLTAYSKDCSQKFEAAFSGGCQGFVLKVEEIPADAEYRIPRPQIEAISSLMAEVAVFRQEEEEKNKQVHAEAERQRLAAKFGVK